MNTVRRSCTELLDQEDGRPSPPKPKPLSSFRDRLAYVLLGDPGEGKTTSLEEECELLGDKGHWITARDFLALSPKPDWRGKTLFIDGLDEVRAGQADARTPFDAIRGRLDTLGSPSFRLSCRMADWLGANDRQHLNAVSPDGAVAVLRLEPLTDGDLRKITGNHPSIGDAQAFLIAAREGGIEPLLRNPQSLKMLMAAFAERGRLPNSRQEVFEIACQRLVLEHNEEHNAISPYPQPDRMLDAAGRLCALQLLAGNAGYAIRPEAVAEDDYPDLRQLDPSLDNIGRDALASKLFSSPAEGRVEPEHRQIAEYLGGRYLAKRIEDGLPSNRIIALMAGRDGTVVTPLRGLSAWTAAHSPTARKDLIDRDAIGVGLYGDVRSFSLDEKGALLRALQQNPIAVRSPYDAARAFGSLAAPGIEEAFREILANPDPGDDAQWFTLFVLRVATEGHPLPDLADLLMQLVRDSTRWSSVNSAALHAFLHCSPPPKRDSKLVALLEDVRSGNVRDDRNELLGLLLIELYPTVVGPRSVWDHLVDNPDKSWVGSYSQFWNHNLLEKSSDQQLAELLDEMARRNLARHQVLEPHHLRDLSAQLLVRGLATHGDQLDANRLYSWLGLNVEDGELLGGYDASLARQVGDWLCEHPDRFKDIVIEGLGQAPESDEFPIHVLDMEARLHNAANPSGFGLWCLKQAIRSDDMQPRTARYLLRQGVQALRREEGGEGLSESFLINSVAGLPNLETHLGHLLAPPKNVEWEDRVQQRQAKWRKQHKEWLETVRSHHLALVENQAPPRILHELARVYLGTTPPDGATKDGPARIREKLANDDSLTQAALGAFRGAVERDDLPTPDQILKLHRDGKLHLLSLPYLAGLAERERLGSHDAVEWPEEQIQRALVLRHCAHRSEHEPEWHQHLVELRPVAVAKAIVKIGASELKQGKSAEGLFWPLERDAAYGEVAKNACLPLLRGFPTRCRTNQLAALGHLLRAAIAQVDQDALRTLIERKLSRKSMNPPQRIHWLTAARTAFGDAYQTELETSINAAGDEHGVRHLVDFLSPGGVVSASLEQFGIGGTESLLRMIGGFCGPEDDFSQSPGTTVAKASRLGHRLLNHLAESPLEPASSALARLSTEPALSRWRGPLSRALEDQRTIRRDAEYRHPKVNQVSETLNQGLPANATDLAALTVDRLQSIAKQVRNSNADDWRQYWNLDSRGMPVEPRHEDACRDALLSDLRQRLPAEVQAAPEGHQANDARADIVLTYKDFQVPVEVKRNQHRDLWSAAKDQLIAKYAPNGPGIYLVFWFGSKATQPSPTGTKPRNPAELEERLAVQLSSEERRRTHIVAIDVERPSPTAAE